MDVQKLLLVLRIPIVMVSSPMAIMWILRPQVPDLKVVCHPRWSPMMANPFITQEVGQIPGAHVPG